MASQTRGEWEWSRVEGAPLYYLQVSTREYESGAPTRYTSRIALTPEQAQTLLRSLNYTKPSTPE
jgi:hypothetical protein